MGYENDVLARPPVVVRNQFHQDEFISDRGDDFIHNTGLSGFFDVTVHAAS